MTKILFKKILIIFMLILLVFSLSACGEINATTITNEDGTVEEKINIVLDTDKILTKLSYEEFEDLKLNIYFQAKLEIKKMVDKFNMLLLVDLNEANTTENTSEVELLNSYKNGMREIEPVWEKNVLTVGVKYNDSNVFKYYYNIPKDQTNEPEVEEYFFYNKVIYSGYSMYVRHFDLYERMSAYYSLYYPEFVNEDQINLSYTYTTDLRRQHSNADSVDFINGKYFHTWNIDKENLSKLKTGEIEYEVILYYNIANNANCILICIAITLLLCLILMVVAIIITKRKKRKRKLN